MTTVAKLKFQLRITDDPADAAIQEQLDAELQTKLNAAFQQAEHKTGKVIKNAAFTEKFIDWSNKFLILKAPFTGVTSITYIALDGSTGTLDQALYEYIAHEHFAEIVIKEDLRNLPDLKIDALRPVAVNFTAGYNVIPAPIETWILMRAAAMDLHRETDNNVGSVEVDFADSLLDSFRRYVI